MIIRLTNPLSSLLKRREEAVTVQKPIEITREDKIKSDRIATITFAIVSFAAIMTVYYLVGK